METSPAADSLDVSSSQDIENNSDERPDGDDGGCMMEELPPEEEKEEKEKEEEAKDQKEVKEEEEEEVVLYKEGEAPKSNPTWFNTASGNKELYHPEYEGEPLVKKATMYLVDIYNEINNKYLEKTTNGRIHGPRSQTSTDIEGYFIPHIGDMITMRYEITGILGKGAYSYVLRCWDGETGGPVAIKVFRKRPEIRDAGRREFEILRVVSGIKDRKPDNKKDKNDDADDIDRQAPYTPELYDSFMWNGHYCIVMELLGKSVLDIYETAHGMTMAEVKRVIRPVLEALVLFKSPGVGIVHCDVKPENIMVTKGEQYPVKLADFSSSCYVGGRGLEYAQTRPYRAPEVAFREPFYGCEVDIFSLGAVMAELVLGAPLFQTASKEDHCLELIRTLGMPTYSMMANSRTDIFNKSALEKEEDKTDFKYKVNEKGFVESKDIIDHISKINTNLIDTKYTSRLAERGKRAYESEMMFLISNREGKNGVLSDEQRVQAYNFINLVLNMLIMDPAQRITPIKALTHPFFSL